MIKKGRCITSKGCGVVCCGGCDKLSSERLCTIYETRPDGCRAYPHNPMALEKGCTLWFEDNGVKITAENLSTFPEETRRQWLDLFIEKSEDE